MNRNSSETLLVAQVERGRTAGRGEVSRECPCDGFQLGPFTNFQEMSCSEIATQEGVVMWRQLRSGR